MTRPYQFQEKLIKEKHKRMHSVTRYLHGAIAAQCNPKIDFSNTNFVILEKTFLEKGRISYESVQESKKYFGFSEKKSVSWDVLIAAKTVVTHFVEGVRRDNQPDDLTGVFFIPAMLNSNGILSFAQKQPIVPREFLAPLVEPELSIGVSERLNQYLSENVARFKKISSWNEYWNYCKELFEYITEQPYENDCLLNGIEFDQKCYLFKNEMVNATKSISDLYDNIQSQTMPLPLYQSLTSLECEKSIYLTQIDNLDSMKSHCASMGGEYPLSPSQREAVIHFNQLTDGEILAVNGPPGTGKTTLLQSIVAGMITSHALKKQAPPLIVASSTNNQAVTNIIDSFGKINPVWTEQCLEEHWLPDINSFAVYFPSSTKNTGDYQCIDYEYSFLANLTTQKYKSEAKKKFIAKFCAYTHKSVNKISECKDYLYGMLSLVDEIRQAVLTKTEEVFKITGTDAKQYLTSLSEKIQFLCNQENALSKKAEKIQKMNDTAVSRILQWEESYAKLPFFIRLFRPFFKTKMLTWFYSFRTQEEMNILAIDNVSIDIIRNAYIQYIQNNNNEIQTIKKEISELKSHIDQLNSNKNELENKINYIIHMINKNSNISDVFKDKDYDTLYRCLLSDTNLLMDTTLRYLEFWLSVHYYECEFLEEKALTEKQLTSNITDVLIKKLHQISLICPCMVMTFFMLPQKMKTFQYNEKVNTYLYNHIDLLIADEAGQTSPEIAAASFALAKKAVIVGDEYQISPVWGTSNVLDVSLAIEAGVIRKPEEFDSIKRKGLNVSESSLMRASSYSCKFHKFSPGLFLSEHRRCYDDIINYCNELLYNGHLEPKRGVSKIKLPCMGYYDIATLKAERDGTSRFNSDEAIQIAKWINNNFNTLCAFYPELKKENVLAIITPFKAQTKHIKRALKEYCTNIENADKTIQVGTVHTFQGAERQIIIFSTVYGSADKCGFIDSNKNLMNVAVSRAKDAFWVFGSIECLKGKSRESASGLLYEYVSSNSIQEKIF